MTLPPPGLTPEPGERGRASDDVETMLADTVNAWDDLLASVADVDMAAVGRKEGRTAARTLVVLGSWPEGRSLPAIRADALAGVTYAEPLDDIEDRVIEAHVDDPAAQILAALARARDEVAAWAASPHANDEALLPVGGPLGVVPLGTLVAATAYQCAVAARDLAPAGVIAPVALTRAGLSSLIDTVGAVAAQQRAAVALTAITPQVVIGVGARDGDWCTRRVPETQQGPAVNCDAGLLLDIAASRASAPAAYARGDLRARDLGGLFALVQVLAQAPGLPGTDGLRIALQAYAASTRVTAAAGQVGDALGGALGGAWRKWRGR